MLRVAAPMRGATDLDRSSAQPRRRRWAGAAGALGIQALVAWALLAGLAFRRPAPVERIVRAITLTPEPRPEPPPPEPARAAAAEREEGRAAPPAKRARPVPVVAPPTPLPILVPPPITAAPVAAQGPDPAAGAADVDAVGTGSGGDGAGFGGGSSGDGAGNGQESGSASERISGRIRDRDYPAGTLMPGERALLTTRYTVGTDGRVTDCEVVEPSGNPALDATTCRLILERFRFRPARDAQGRPVPDVVLHDHEWFRRERP